MDGREAGQASDDTDASRLGRGPPEPSIPAGLQFILRLQSGPGPDDEEGNAIFAELREEYISRYFNDGKITFS